jgi:hypothetical protein
MTQHQKLVSKEAITAIIIDDDHDTVDVFKEYLELKNVHVLGKGYNGKDAIALYRQFRPGCCISRCHDARL